MIDHPADVFHYEGTGIQAEETIMQDEHLNAD